LELELLKVETFLTSKAFQVRIFEGLRVLRVLRVFRFWFLGFRVFRVLGLWVFMGGFEGLGYFRVKGSTESQLGA
jgi:hypothetical protein